MIRFTEAGVVASPTTLQIRVTRRFPQRVAAGAPVPSRSLDDAELVANIRHFTEGMRGPRTRPCDALVLSGLQLSTRLGLHVVLNDAQGLGIQRVTLHLGAEDVAGLVDSPLRDLVNAVAISVRRPDEVRGTRRSSIPITAVVPLDMEVITGLKELTACLLAERPDRVVFTWPFPPAAPPPAPETVVPALRIALQDLEQAGVLCGVKGLASCHLGGAIDKVWRSANRWYVDAEHQLAEALLFFPDVVRFAKSDSCRRCVVNHRCDGVSDRWLHSGLAGILEPVLTLESSTLDS